MNGTYSFRCTCGNKAKNLMTTSSGELIAKCGRCTPGRTIVVPIAGMPTITPLENVALTDQLAAKIREDTSRVVAAMNDERERKLTRLSKANQVLSTYTSMEREKEIEVSLQVFGEDNLSLPSSFATSGAKWKHMPYMALQLTFEFLGEWGPNQVSRRWYDCFMNYSFKLEIPTNKLVRAISRCARSTTVVSPGWSDEHASFWKKLTACHTETISLLSILPTIASPQFMRPHQLRQTFTNWVLHEIIRPCFVVRDKTLMDHLKGHFEEEDWIRGTMKSEFSRIVRIFADLRRFPLFLREYGHLMEEFGLTPKMLDEMEKLPTESE